MTEQLVRVTFLIRLACLAVGAVALFGHPLSLEMAAAVLLGLASYVGLSRPRFRAALIAHPLLAMTDLALISIVVLGLGVLSPLALATVSTALLIGVLYPMPFALLPGGLLVCVVAAGALAEQRHGVAVGFMSLIGLPAVLAMLVYIGHAIQMIHRSERRALDELAVQRVGAAADAERLRLAREVHDGVAKSLQGLALTAAGLPLWVDRDASRAKTEASNLAAGAGRAVDEARRLLGQLRADDSRRDLTEVLDDVVSTWQLRTGRVVQRDLDPVPALCPDARYELLAALREGLENVDRHTDEAAGVRLGLYPDGAGLRLVLEDDGPGFDPAILPAREAEGHFGVRGMSERLARVDGRVELTSVPGEGTRLVFVLGRGALSTGLDAPDGADRTIDLRSQVGEEVAG